MSESPGRVDVDAFWERGFDMVRAVFTPDEIHRLRQDALAHPDHKGDLLSHPSLSGVVTHPGMLNIARDLLGATPVYFGFSSVTLGELGRGYHKDNADRWDAAAPDWQGRYTLIRLGIYLQDHTAHSGGLNLRAGSHQHISLRKGRTVYANTATGDVVVWNLRTSHSANGYLLKFPIGLHLPPRLGARLPGALMRGLEKERAAIFITYALPDAHLERYLTYLKARTFMVDLWRNSPVPEEVRQTLASSPLLFRDVWSEIRDTPGLGQHRDHVEIPY